MPRKPYSDHRKLPRGRNKSINNYRRVGSVMMEIDGDRYDSHPYGVTRNRDYVPLIIKNPRKDGKQKWSTPMQSTKQLRSFIQITSTDHYWKGFVAPDGSVQSKS